MLTSHVKTVVSIIGDVLFNTEISDQLLAILYAGMKPPNIKGFSKNCRVLLAN